MFAIILFALIAIQLSNQSIFDCDVQEPSTRFMLLKLRPNVTELMVLEDAQQLDENLKTYIVIHGWQEGPTRKWNLELSKTLATNENCNVVVMDYSKWARKFYNCAKRMVEVAGRALAEFIIKSTDKNSISLDNLQLIGFSLGTHVAGFAGRTVLGELNRTVYRITALDPAGPLFTEPFAFNDDGLPLALSSTDAEVVDVLHTSLLIGAPVPLGTVDFFAESLYEDGIQPACLNDINIGCSHNIARKYYIESISSCGIKAEEANQQIGENSTELVTFGHHMAPNITGIYIFTAKDTAPYGSFPPECLNN